MKLKVKLTSILSSTEISLESVDSISLDRTLGEAVKWYFALNFSQELKNHVIESVVNLIINERCEIQGFVEDAECTPPVRVIGFLQGPKDKAERSFIVEAAHTKAKRKETSFDPITDPFVPRRRVLHAKNLYDLVSQFDHITNIPDSIQFQLKEVVFPDEDYAVLIQDNVSDWEYLNGLLYRFSSLNQWVNPMLLSGMVDEDHPLWSVAWGAQQVYVDKGEVEGRTVELDGRGRLYFSFDKLTNFGIGPDTDGSSVPVTHFIYPQRSFSTDGWKEWGEKNMPVFTKDGEQNRMVYSVRDKIELSGGTDLLNWETKLSYLPSPVTIRPKRVDSALKPWIGMGEVVENDTKDYWLKIRLPGFQDNEEKDNHVNVRLTTPYSGEEGNAGLHLVPEKGTMVAVAWSGSWSDSVVLLSNVRMAETGIEHPSLQLEKPMTWQMKDLDWGLDGLSVVSKDIEWQSGNQEWKTKNVSINSKGNHSVAASGTATVEAKGKANVKGATVNVEAKTSVAINGTTDVKINC